MPMPIFAPVERPPDCDEGVGVDEFMEEGLEPESEPVGVGPEAVGDGSIVEAAASRDESESFHQIGTPSPLTEVAVVKVFVVTVPRAQLCPLKTGFTKPATWPCVMEEAH